jgi:Uma2 family endonuclease
MGSESSSRLTYADLEHFPNDGLRREIIDGVLHVTPSPFLRHQRVVGRIFRALADVLEAAGGEAFSAPLDVVFDRFNVVEPDVLAVAAEKAKMLGDRHVYVVPDMAVEVSSPGTKGVDRLKKRALYERFGVPEYWIVDLDADVIEAYVLRDGRYGEPSRFSPGDIVTSAVIPGFSRPFDELVPA